MENDAISKEMLNEFIQVAEIKLTDEEKASILATMNDQLKVIHELAAIPVEPGMPPVIHGNPFPVEIQAPLREDVWIPFDHPEEIVNLAPRHRDGYIVSPDVPHQTLG
jgi:aspartyl/glutamyl-tRNA(Asn/Gln) amidotransferase C subunit